jgi:hypothetical protein
MNRLEWELWYLVRSKILCHWSKPHRTTSLICFRTILTTTSPSLSIVAALFSWYSPFGWILYFGHGVPLKGHGVSLCAHLSYLVHTPLARNHNCTLGFDRNLWTRQTLSRGHPGVNLGEATMLGRRVGKVFVWFTIYLFHCNRGSEQMVHCFGEGKVVHPCRVKSIWVPASTVMNMLGYFTHEIEVLMVKWVGIGLHFENVEPSNAFLIKLLFLHSIDC